MSLYRNMIELRQAVRRLSNRIAATKLPAVLLQFIVPSVKKNKGKKKNSDGSGFAPIACWAVSRLCVAGCGKRAEPRNPHRRCGHKRNDMGGGRVQH